MPLTEEQLPVAVKSEREMVAAGEQGVQLTTLEGMFRFAEVISRAQLAPKSMSSPEQILIAVQTGLEAGLTPMAALRSVVVINRQATWRGNMAVALVKRSRVLESYDEGVDGEGDERFGWCETKRLGENQTRRTQFSVAQAKQAGLWNKRTRENQPTPWVTYPERMLKWRAVGFHLNDHFSDILFGMHIAEEVADYPQDERIIKDVTPTGDDPLIEAAMEEQWENSAPAPSTPSADSDTLSPSAAPDATANILGRRSPEILPPESAESESGLQHSESPSPATDTEFESSDGDPIFGLMGGEPAAQPKAAEPAKREMVPPCGKYIQKTDEMCALNDKHAGSCAGPSQLF